MDLRLDQQSERAREAFQKSLSPRVSLGELEFGGMPSGPCRCWEGPEARMVQNVSA